MEPEKKYKSGRKHQPIRWKYGEESDFYLLVKDAGGQWLKPLYSHDVKNKSLRKGGRGTLGDAEKIARLKALFARGGTRGVSFQPETVTVAVIVPKGEKAAKACERWTPEKHWHQPETRRPAPPENPAPAEWKLWMPTSPRSFVLSVHRDLPEIRQFSGLVLEKRPELCARYADPETGELSLDFVMALYLGSVAKTKKDQASRAYLYRAGSTRPDLRIDLASGRVCGVGAGAGWIVPEYFFSLQPIAK